MDYDEDKIRKLILAGLKNPEPWWVELEQFDYGARLGVFYRGLDGVKRPQTDTKGKTEEQIAFALLSQIMNEPVQASELPSPYEGKRGKHPRTCTCSKHKVVDGQQAA